MSLIVAVIPAPTTRLLFSRRMSTREIWIWMDKADTRNPTRVQIWTLPAVQARTDFGGYLVERVLTRCRVNWASTARFTAEVVRTTRLNNATLGLVELLFSRTPG